MYAHIYFFLCNELFSQLLALHILLYNAQPIIIIDHSQMGIISSRNNPTQPPQPDPNS